MKRSNLFLVLTSMLLAQPSDGDAFSPKKSMYIPLSHLSGSDYSYTIDRQSNYRRRGRHATMSSCQKGTGIVSRIGSIIKSRVIRKNVSLSTRNSKSDGNPYLIPKDAPHIIQGMARKRPRWLKFPKVGQEAIVQAASAVKVAALVAIGVELFFILRDIFEEIFDDLECLVDDVLSGTAEAGSVSKQKVLSKSCVRKIIAWLENGAVKSAAPPPSVAPSWILAIAQELHNYATVSLDEVEKILLRLTNANAVLLVSTLLTSKNMVDFEDIGGLFAARTATAQLLLSHVSNLSALRNADKLSTADSSPYMKLIAEENGLCDMVLWGPSGAGKSLLTHALATSSGLPTLVVTPSLMQRSDSIEGLFSLVSILGSCVVILDDLDGIFPVLSGGGYSPVFEWLQRWDKFVSASANSASKVSMLTIAATSRPWEVDTSAWRRIPNRIYIGLPNAEDRYDMLKKWSKDLPPLEDSVLQYFVSVTEGYIPTDLYHVLINACKQGPIARQDSKLSIEDVQTGLSTVLPTRFSARYIQQLQAFIGAGSTTESPSATQQTSPATSRQDYFSPHAVQALPYCENGYCWQTQLGNFYQFHVPVDSQVLTAIQTILLHTFEWGSGDEWGSSDDWDLSDDEDDEEDDFSAMDID